MCSHTYIYCSLCLKSSFPRDPICEPCIAAKSKNEHCACATVGLREYPPSPESYELDEHEIDCLSRQMGWGEPKALSRSLKSRAKNALRRLVQRFRKNNRDEEEKPEVDCFVLSSGF